MHSVDEVEEFLGVADALVVKVGTLSKDWVESMQLAAKTAYKLGKPWVLDPVGAGATKFRTQVGEERCLSPPLIRTAFCMERQSEATGMTVQVCSFTNV